MKTFAVWVVAALLALGWAQHLHSDDGAELLKEEEDGNQFNLTQHLSPLLSRLSRSPTFKKKSNYCPICGGGGYGGHPVGHPGRGGGCPGGCGGQGGSFSYSQSSASSQSFSGGYGRG